MATDQPPIDDSWRGDDDVGYVKPGSLYDGMLRSQEAGTRVAARRLLDDYVSHKGGGFRWAARLGLPTSPRHARLALRDLALQTLAELVAAEDPTAAVSQVIAKVTYLIDRHLTRGTFGRWEKGGVSSFATPTEKETHRFLRLNNGDSLSSKQVGRIVGHLVPLRCPPPARSIAPVDAAPLGQGRGN